MKQKHLTVIISLIFLMAISGKVFATVIGRDHSLCPICGSNNKYPTHHSSPIFYNPQNHIPFEQETSYQPYIYHCQNCRFTIYVYDYIRKNSILNDNIQGKDIIEKIKSLLLNCRYKGRLKDVKNISNYRQYEIMERIYQLIFDEKTSIAKYDFPRKSMNWSRFFFLMGYYYHVDHLPEKAQNAFRKSLSRIDTILDNVPSRFGHYWKDFLIEKEILLFSGTIKHFLMENTAALSDYKASLLVTPMIDTENGEYFLHQDLFADQYLSRSAIVNAREIYNTTQNKSIRFYYELGMIYLIYFFRIEPVLLLLYFSLFGLFILSYFIMIKTKNKVKTISYRFGLYFLCAVVGSILSYMIIKKVGRIGSIRALAIITLSYIAWSIVIHWLPGKAKLTSNPLSLTIAFKQKVWLVLKTLSILFPFVFCLYLNPSIRAFPNAFFTPKDFEGGGFLFFSLLPFLAIILGIESIYFFLNLIQKKAPKHFPGKAIDYLFSLLCLGVMIIGTSAFVYSTSFKVHPRIYLLLGGVWFLLFVLIEYFFQAFTKYRIIKCDFFKRMYESKFWVLIRFSFFAGPVVIGYNRYWFEFWHKL